MKQESFLSPLAIRPFPAIMSCSLHGVRRGSAGSQKEQESKHLADSSWHASCEGKGLGCGAPQEIGLSGMLKIECLGRFLSCVSAWPLAWVRNGSDPWGKPLKGAGPALPPCWALWPCLCQHSSGKAPASSAHCFSRNSYCVPRLLD